MDVIGLFLGWWLPALLFYGFGLVALGLAFSRRTWAAALLVWLAAAGFLLWEAQYDNRVRKPDFEARAATFKDLVIFAPPPAEVRRIATAENDDRLPEERAWRFHSRPPGFTGYEQNCATFCLQMLLSGRFDEYIIFYRIPAEMRRQAPSKFLDQRDHTRNYRLLRQPGCRSSAAMAPYVQDIMRLWQTAGTCLVETKTAAVNGPHFAVTTLPNAPELRRWQQRVTHIRLAGSGDDRDIARAEYGVAAFAFEFPYPGLFPQRGWEDFQPDLLRRPRQSYGPMLLATEVVGRVFGVSSATDVDKLPKPPSQ
jgi:hypothetical protein